MPRLRENIKENMKIWYIVYHVQQPLDQEIGGLCPRFPWGRKMIPLTTRAAPREGPRGLEHSANTEAPKPASKCVLKQVAISIFTSGTLYY